MRYSVPSHAVDELKILNNDIAQLTYYQNSALLMSISLASHIAHTVHPNTLSTNKPNQNQQKKLAKDITAQAN